jgi:hypothetical protein
MTVKDLAEQLNELYTKAEKNGIDIENYTIVISNWSPESTLMVNTRKRIVEIL